jgi:hypothetical protein
VATGCQAPLEIRDVLVGILVIRRKAVRGQEIVVQVCFPSVTESLLNGDSHARAARSGTR